MQIWDIEKAGCISTLDWGCDSILQVRLNPTENYIGLCTGID